MKQFALVLILLMMVLFSASSHAVPPAHVSQFGNPEEPALRIVKWPWLGFRKLVVRVHEGLERGIHQHPPAAVAEGACGGVHGAGTLVDHTARGLVYMPLPPKAPIRTKTTYEDQVHAYLQDVTGEVKEVQEEEVEVVQEPSDNEQDSEKTAYLPRKAVETDVSRAQRRYVPLQASYRERTDVSGGNLLRLAR